MEITKEILIREVKELIESQCVSSYSIGSVVNTLFNLMKTHVKKGNKINIQEFSVRPKGQRKHKNRTYSVRSSNVIARSGYQQDSEKIAGRYSSNFLINELFLMVYDRQYLLKKTKKFFRTVIVTVAFVIVYYLSAVLMGC